MTTGKLLTSAALVASVLLPAPNTSCAADRPNILLLLIDNLGRDWFGCYGSDEKATPVMDRLAAEGMRFTTCWSTPLCSTSRVELLTGRYGFRTGWHTHHDAGIYGGGNFDCRRELTFARVLRGAGYATAMAGKWQINDFFEPGQQDALRQNGFDEHCLWPDGHKGHPANAQRYWDPYILLNGRKIDAGGRFGPDVFDEFVIDFLRRHRDHPFLMYYPMSLTHIPVVKTPHFRDEQAPQRQLFAEMVRYTDFEVGRLTKALTDLGLRERTIVIVTTDNGTAPKLVGKMQGQSHRGGVGTNRELGINVPLIVNCPGRVPAGRVVHELVDFSDFLPTLADLAGAPLPAGVTIDGRSFAGLLRGGERRPRRDWVFSQYYRTRMVGDGRYKLYNTGELFDVLQDVDESVDLSKQDDRRLAAVRSRLRAVLDSLPKDAELPFAPRSQSAFAIRAREAQPAPAAKPPR